MNFQFFVETLLIISCIQRGRLFVLRFPSTSCENETSSLSKVHFLQITRSLNIYIQ